MTTQGRRPFGLVWTVISTASFRTVISTASVRRSCHPSRVFDRLMAHRSVESNRGPSPISGFIGRRDGVSITDSAPLGGCSPAPDTGGLPPDHLGPFNGLVTFRTVSVPPAMLPTSSPTSRFIVASASSGTQPTVSVCWATQLFIRSWHVACVAQSRITVPAARYELLEHRRQQSRPFLRVLAQPALAVALP